MIVRTGATPVLAMLFIVIHPDNHWIGFVGKIETGNHCFYHSIHGGVWFTILP